MILGKDKVIANLKIAGQRATATAKEGVREMAVMTGMIAIENAPKLTGALRGSVVVTEAKQGLGFTITMGGDEAPYAVIVHEDLTAHHDVGGAKFLERAMATVSSVFAQKVAQKVRFG